MPDNENSLPSTETMQALLKIIAPESSVTSVDSLPGSFSNFTHRVEIRAPDGSINYIVIRRYAVFGDYDRGQKAAREFKTYELLQKQGIPAPQPLYLDQDGLLLGTPGIVTSYIPGRLILSPSDLRTWARPLAKTLAQIHSVPCHPSEQTFLLKADLEATWFLRSGTPPPYMKAHRQGMAIWQMVDELFPRLQKTQAGLVHVDYWPGNILWEENQITGVVDWEEAAYGDPAIDVAYCRMNMVLGGLAQAAEKFLRTYELEIGQPVVNLGFWELAAAARPMMDPEGWKIAEPPGSDKFRQFIESASERMGS